MTTWFTADQHFFHRQVIMHCTRPFKNEPTMRKEIITRHNQRVRKDDTVYMIGDIAMIGNSQWEHLKGVIQQLNGRKHLIFGNHDELKWQQYLNLGFTSVHSAHWLTLEGIHLVLAHDPSVYCTLNSQSVLVHGHIHTLYKSIPDQLVINAGVDMWDFFPINLDNIKKELSI